MTMNLVFPALKGIQERCYFLLSLVERTELCHYISVTSQVNMEMALRCANGSSFSPVIVGRFFHSCGDMVVLALDSKEL